MGCTWLERNPFEAAYIYSDSLSALQAISAGPTGTRVEIIMEILCCLRRIESLGSSVHFCWVPSHSKIVGNEMVDQIAKQSIHCNNIEYKISFSKMECVSIIKGAVQKMWQTDWEKEKRGRHYFVCQPLVQNSRLLWTSCRKAQVKITRLRLGHCGLASYLKIMGKHPDGLCHCGQPETISHVLLACSQYTVQRKILFQQLSDFSLNVFSIKSIFSSRANSWLIDKALISFLLSTNLYERI